VLYVELLAIIIVIEQAHARGCSNFGLKATLRLLYRPLRSHLLFLGTCETVGITFLPGILMTGIFFFAIMMTGIQLVFLVFVYSYFWTLKTKYKKNLRNKATCRRRQEFKKMPKREKKVDKHCASTVATMTPIVPRWEDLGTKEFSQQSVLFLKHIHSIVARMARRSPIPNI
jgi:hypothetical protein